MIIIIRIIIFNPTILMDLRYENQKRLWCTRELGDNVPVICYRSQLKNQISGLFDFVTDGLPSEFVTGLYKPILIGFIITAIITIIIIIIIIISNSYYYYE